MKFRRQSIDLQNKQCIFNINSRKNRSKDYVVNRIKIEIDRNRKKQSFQMFERTTSSISIYFCRFQCQPNTFNLADDSLNKQ